MSDRVLEAIKTREALSRGDSATSYRDLQKAAKDLGIPANQSADELQAAIDEKAEDGAARE